MRHLFFLFFILCFSASEVAAQKPPETATEYERAYQQRIQREMINGVYIPKDMSEAFVELNRLVDEESRNKFKAIPETVAAEKLHFSFGRWLIKNWSFYEGSRLSVYLNQIGLFHPDDLARFVVITYHRNLNREPLEVKALVEQLQEARQQLEATRRQNAPKTIISEEKRKRQ